MMENKLAAVKKMRENLKGFMSNILPGIGLLIILLGSAPILVAQVTGSSSPESKKTANKADQNLRSVARINPSTLAMEFSLPLMGYPGRSGNSMPIGLNYSSKVWRMESGFTWWYWQNTQPKYVTDIKSRYGERSAAGWTSTLIPPRLDETSPQLYKEDGQPWSINIFDVAGINGYWQNMLSGFAENLAPCGARCQAFTRTCDGNGANCGPWGCASWTYEFCDDMDPNFPTSPPPTPLYYVKRLQVAMPDGSTNEFRAGDQPVACGTNQNVCTPDMTGTYLSVDGSGLKLIKTGTGSTLYLPDGSRYLFPVGNSVEGTFATEFIDNDGNKMSFSRTTVDNLTTNKWTDTMGRPIIDPLPQNWITQTQVKGTKQVDLPGLDGEDQKYEMKWSNLKPVGCETDTTGNCGAVGGTVDGALEDQTQKLYYETRYFCQGNVSVDLNTNNEVLFANQESGIRSCNSFDVQRNANGQVILDGNGNPIPFATRFNPVVLSEIKLPNNKKYIFKYNRFGEITKIIHPTGSFETFEYGYIQPMNGAGSPAYDQTNRGVTEHRIYDGNSVEQQRWQYTAAYDYNGGNSIYKITTKGPTGSNPTALVKKSERFLHIDIVGNSYFGHNDPRAGRPKEELSYDELENLRSRTLYEYFTKNIATTGFGSFSRDLRSGRSVSVAIENNISLASLSETEYDETGSTDPEHFSHLNVKRTKGYHYASIPLSLAQTGTITQISAYFNNNLLAGISETDYVYDANYKARGIPSLAVETRVLNPQNNDILARTQTVYDDAVPMQTAQEVDYPSSYTIENYGISASFQCPSGNTTVTCWQTPNSNHLGRPTTVRLWDDDNDIWHESHTRYDIFGNAVKVKDAAGNEASTEFANSYLYAYPTKVITPAPDPTGTTGTNQTSVAETTYDFMTGLTLSVKNDFGQITKTEYNDPLLRPTRVYADNYTAPEAQTVYDDTNLTVKVRKQIDSTNWDEATTFLDSLGRTIKTQSKDSQGDVFTETEYDLLGRVKRSSNPYRAGETKLWTMTAYDELSRIKFITTPDNAVVETQYALSTSGDLGMATTVIDQAGKKRRSITNALQQLIRVDEPNESNQLGSLDAPHQPTRYEYTGLGDLKKVIQGEQERNFTYDSLKRLKSAQNPESGMITYEYDAVSNLTQKTDSRGVSTHYSYDKVNRIVSRSYTGETGYQTPSVNYYYDGVNSSQAVPFGKGKLTKVTSSVSTTEYTSFDELGRVVAHKQTTDGQSYPTSYVYNLSGALLEQTYPSNRVVKNTLDADGDLQQVQSQKANNTLRNYANGFTYTKWGAISAVRLGNGRWENTQFNDRLQPVQIGLGTSAANQNLLKLNYDYGTTDNNGNIKSQTITVPTETRNGTTYNGFTALQTYTYDSLNRLKSAVENINSNQTAEWKQAFQYDRYGNRNFETSNTTTLGGCPTNICNPSINQQNNRLIGYQFDNAGNTTTDAENRTFIYDGENKQVEVKDVNGISIGKYYYDGDGKRVKKITAQETTVFVYNAGGQLIAESSTKLSETPQISYLTTDHLGSPRINTNQDGQVTARHDYQPFGEEILRASYGTDDVKKKFTGYERDTETDLDFAQARYYAKNLGRFTAVDPSRKSVFIEQPKTWNRYIYCLNNPLRFIDSNGKWPTSTHDNILRKALDLIDEPTMKRIQDGSRKVDVDGLNPKTLWEKNTPQHAMTPLTKVKELGSAEKAKEWARKEAITFIENNLAAAKSLFEKSNKATNPFYDKKKAVLNSLELFGIAMHPVMDNVSPSHIGFQVYDNATPASTGATIGGATNGTVGAGVGIVVSVAGGLLDHSAKESREPTAEEMNLMVDEIRLRYRETFGQEAYELAVSEKERKLTEERLAKRGTNGMLKN